ncbi:MAG: hypothetical protein WCL32_19135 [Planctomycetota bacterium]
MKFTSIGLGIAFGMACCGIGVAQEIKSFSFKGTDQGKVPGGWKAGQTGMGTGSVWKVVADSTVPSKSGFALAQTAEGANIFNLCVAEDSKFNNGDISVAFKAIKGVSDQGGGLVWRFQDANNYYVCRMNPLEDNYRLYKVVDGKRIQLATREGLKVLVNEWHILKVKHVNGTIECFLDGMKMLEATDAAIAGAGKVGVWSKADAQTYFDNLTIHSTKE